MKIFDLKNYGIDDLSKESFEIKKIIKPFKKYYFDENYIMHTKIEKLKGYILINKETNQQIMIDWGYKTYKTFKKALLAILRDKSRIDTIIHNKCEKFYNYQQDKDSFKEYYKTHYSIFDEKINPKCFLHLLKKYNGHMSKAIMKYIEIIEDGDFYNETDYINELIYNQIPHRYYKNEYFIRNIPKYAKLMSKEFLYKKGGKFYNEEITPDLKKEFKMDEKYYKELMYDMVKENKKNNNKDFYKNLYKKIIESE